MLYYLIYCIFEVFKIDHYNQIIPNLYLGNYCSLYLRDFDLVVNCTKDLNFENIKAKKVRIPIDDNYIFKNNEMLNYLNNLDIIDEYINNNKKVLVFCKFGFQRSTTIVFLYLYLKKKIDKKEIKYIIKSNRTISYYILNNFSHIIEKI